MVADRATPPGIKGARNIDGPPKLPRLAAKDNGPAAKDVPLQNSSPHDLEEINRLQDVVKQLTTELKELQTEVRNKHQSESSVLDDCGRLRILLDQEREKRHLMQHTYESHLQKLRSESISKIASARTCVMRDVDDVLQKYSRLAKDALTAAKRAKERAELLESEVKKTSQETCRAFEIHCKDRVKEVLDGYRYLADKASEEADVESKMLRTRCITLEKELILEREKAEQTALEIAEEQVNQLQSQFLQVQRENRQLKFDYDNSLQKMKIEVAGEFRRIETQIISSSLELLWAAGSHVTEAEYREKLSAALEG